MATKKDGGSAFPTWDEARYVTSDAIRESAGMSLRAYFAGQVISPMLVQAYGNTTDILARKAVEIADALIAELNKE